MRATFVSLIIMISFALAGWADQPLTAHLELVPNRTLPGIPVMFVVTVTNPNNGSKSFFEYAGLRVVDSHGAAFDVSWGQRDGGTYLSTPRAGQGASYTAAIPGGGTTAFYVPVGVELLENGAFYDSRLCVPGTYDLQMTLGQSGETRTNIARLTVEQPTGTDLAFWHAASDAAGPRGLNASTWLQAGGLVEKYPESRYYHLLAFHRAASEKPEEMIALMKQALTAGVTGPIADEFQEQAAYSFEGLAQREANGGNFKAADSALEQARAYVERTIDHPSTDYSRQVANDVYVHLQATAAGIERMRLRRSVSLWQPMKVFVQCREHDGSVRFGYQNPNGTVLIKVGTENHFDPGPTDRGQPVQFAPGDGSHFFSAALLAGERKLSWVLKGATATFSLDAEVTRKCTDDDEGQDH
jgi:hypothetical protein